MHQNHIADPSLLGFTAVIRTLRPASRMCFHRMTSECRFSGKVPGVILAKQSTSKTLGKFLQRCISLFSTLVVADFIATGDAFHQRLFCHAFSFVKKSRWFSGSGSERFRTGTNGLLILTCQRDTHAWSLCQKERKTRPRTLHRQHHVRMTDVKLRFHHAG